MINTYGREKLVVNKRKIIHQISYYLSDLSYIIIDVANTTREGEIIYFDIKNRDASIPTVNDFQVIQKYKYNHKRIISCKNAVDDKTGATYIRAYFII